MEKLFSDILTKRKSLVLADQAVFSGSSFLMTIMMARILGPYEFGIFATIILFIYLLINILNSIVIQPLQVSLASISNKSSYISFSFWLQLALVIFLSFTIAIISKFNFSIFEKYNDLALSILSISTGFLLHDYFRKVFLAKAEILRSLIIDLLTSFLHISILFTAYFFLNLTFPEIVLIIGIGYTPAIVVSVIFIHPRLPDLAEWKTYILKHYHQSKWLLVTALVQWWSGNLFVVASGLFLGLQALGAFRLVQSVFGVLNVLLQTFENYALPQTSRHLLTSHTKAKNYLKQIGIKSSFFFGFILLPAFIFSKHIIILTGGPNYAEYDYVVRGMVILYIFIFLGYPIRMAIRALVLNKNFFLGYAFSLLLSLTSFNFLLEKWALIGAITGLIISQIVMLGYWQHILIKNNFSIWK